MKTWKDYRPEHGSMLMIGHHSYEAIQSDARKDLEDKIKEFKGLVEMECRQHCVGRLEDGSIVHKCYCLLGEYTALFEKE